MRTPSHNERRLLPIWICLSVVFGLAAIASLLVGDGDLGDEALRATFLKLRAWRLANSALAGVALATAGVLVQGLFRNPLASPSILGTSAGASLGGVATLLLWNGTLASRFATWLPAELALPVGCLLGAWLSLVLLLAVTGRDSGVVTVLLTGFVLSSLFLSVGGLLMSMAQDSWELGRAVVAFTLGGIHSKGPLHAALAFPMVVVGAVMALSWSRHLDLLLSGEDEARSLGMDVIVVRRWVIAWASMLVAAAVAIGGSVAFVGLVVPHALRPFVGEEHHRLLPASMIGGAAFLTWADVLTRVVPTTGQVPLGVVTGLIGAPIFLVLLARASREGRIE